MQDAVGRGNHKEYAMSAYLQMAGWGIAAIAINPIGFLMIVSVIGSVI